MSTAYVTWHKTGCLATTALNQFWQDSETGAFDPEIPNLPLELQPLTAALAATESSDTVDIAASLSGGAITASFAITESSDTASISASARHTASLAVTESSDTASFAASARHTASLAVTESSDTVSIAASARHTAALAVTESSDTVAINASVASSTITASFAVTESSDTAAFAAIGAAEQPTGGGHAWKGPAEQKYRVHPEYEDRPKKKKKAKQGQQVILAGEPEIQTGIIEVSPAFDALGELERRQKEAEIARLKRLRAIAEADDEWLMVA